MQLETGNLSLFCLSAKLVSYHTVTVLISFSILNLFIHVENTSIVSFSHIARKVLIRLDDKKRQFQTEVFKLSHYNHTLKSSCPIFDGLVSNLTSQCQEDSV